jgi:GNAT superfamily N-acetyltransferase
VIEMLDIRRVDPEDDEAMESYAAIGTESDAFENPFPTPFTLEEHREELRNKVPLTYVEGFLGVDGDVPVTAGTAEIFLTDNVEKGWVYVHTLPAHRGRGFGSTMLDFVVDRVKAEQRTTILTGTDFPFGADESYYKRRFLTGRGFSLANSEVHRVLELPADEAVLDRLAEDAAPHHTDYTLADFDGLVPEEMREGYCVLLNQIMVDAPSGTVDFEEGSTTPDILVERAASRRATGRSTYITVALDGDGVPVAHNVLQVTGTDDGNIFNQDTLVRRDHRGHRLGYATKIRNLRRVAALHPDRTTVHTWNAESNGPMISINDAMGFRPVMCGGEYVRNL